MNSASEKHSRRITVQHILVRNQQLADQLHQELSAGADFAAIAREYSICPSADNQGHCGKQDPDSLADGLLEALSPDHDETYPKPVKTELGFHLLKVNERLQRPVLLDDAG